MTTDNHYENLIVRCLNGDASDGEMEALIAWIEKHPDHQKIYSETKDTWDSISPPELSIDQQLISFYKNQAQKRAKIRLPYWKKAVAIAAVLAIGLFTGILWMDIRQSEPEADIVFSVPYGSKSTVVLADGSEVVLNAGSTFSYPSNFAGKTRHVKLTGEGFFRVSHASRKPFVVSTNDFSVEVKGTSFNINSYEDNPFCSTTLEEGMIMVSLTRSGQSFEVKPGERFRYDRESNRYSKTAVDVETDIAWKNDEFIFRNIPFPELARRLERWYDVRIIYSSMELREFTYTGRFKNQETIWQVLDALKLTTPIDYRRINFREFEIQYNPAGK